MSWKTRMYMQVAAFGFVGVNLAYFFGGGLSAQTVVDIVRAVGSISAIAGAFVGWSIGWIAQSRYAILDNEYDAAVEFAKKLECLQKEMILKWSVALSCSVVAVVCAILASQAEPQSSSAEPNESGLHWVLVASSGLMTIAVAFVFHLFRYMLKLSALKFTLEESERIKLKKKRLLP